VAQLVGARPGEIAFTRGATEALQCLIAQYNRLRPGDTVLYADVDYMAMQHAMNWLADRRGVTVARFDLPEPASQEAALAAYDRALTEHPKTRLVLLTHLNNKSGGIIPVKQITELARARGADVVVDAAHSFGQLDLTLADLGADFVGFNLHKWIGTPIGVGVMYIREGRLPDVDRMYGDETSAATSINSRIHTGTANFATYLTVPAALDFHAAVGPAYKAARVRYLRDRWVSQVRGTPGIDVLTLDDPSVAAITSFRIGKRTTRAANQAVVTELLERYRLFTAWRTGLAGGDCVRVTPALYNAPGDADRLAAALKEIAGRG
jgi:selenocysteine lyase/cysteine desulfurase